ncbi:MULTISPECIES: helix-turn-helix domain-containing protein [unclassified Streptomyces]|uniref:helix-turn-helix domain-containing protein n=1 Tax=unclassified Streptomyces TaxID=2593676 RepID=UPI00136EBA29|nr:MULTISPECIES: helix-turn-helix domain-containing protein [unclassified Streptomyces]NEA00008.1 helix-turn-helix domain-containing protein [Streptomyces sp. SID10116]MYY85651.1 helix-turn-helix domain-containing protein [Streptomyces sp. SID335]MYZ15948.1 helix-turn-helix domain-containing protein [Streptomyces sp. SID337]NDZ86050.1 helix-turn-helix domain-containing protein [Streptomyces sp. SID10115]NEB45342.1 helix-turn-helix domain-containing protein [Streptomyces sp. SID339]
MDLEQRVAELERRMAELESAEPAAPAVGEGDFWALDALKARHPVTEDADGAVLFTGSVRVPTGHRYEWQYGLLTESVFEGDWSEVAESFAALGNPVRLRLLREILGGLRTAAELAALDDVGTTGQIYHHLRQLTGAGWLHSTGRGRYEVPAGRVVPLLVALTAAKPVS